MDNNNKVVESNKRSLSGVQMNKGVFGSSDTFMVGAKMARALASSTIVPDTYKNNEGNCLIAVDMASRLNISPIMVCQNLYIIKGKPSWSSQFIISAINGSERYKGELMYNMQGSGMDLSCYAYAISSEGNEVKGPTITMQMAKQEGWLSKAGSKWQTMPEVMIRYRAASFFGRLHCPDLIMGIYSSDEVKEMENAEYEVIKEERQEQPKEKIAFKQPEPAPEVEPEVELEELPDEPNF